MNAPTLDALGLTLLHSLWQGTVIALLLAGCLATFLRHAAPRIRSRAAWLSLFAMAATSALTLASQERAREPSHPTDRNPAFLPPPLATAPIPHPDPSSIWESGRPSLTGTRLLALIWMLGTFFSLARTAGGWWRLRRLCGSAVPVGDPEILRLFAQARARLGIRERVRLRTCAAIDTPLMAGFLWPTVLLPAAMLQGVPAPYLQALLSHELAHFRRWDYVANLIQNLIEAAYFYHPAVRWISRIIREEREQACDDLAAGQSGGPRRYAQALAWLETRRESFPPSPLAMAARRGSTLARIERLVRQSASSSTQQGRVADSTLLTWPIWGLAALLPFAFEASGQAPADPTVDRIFTESETRQWSESIQKRIGEIEGVLTFLNAAPPAWRHRKPSLFASGLVIEKDGREIKLTEDFPRVFEDLPNAWILENQLDPLDSSLPDRDEDGDGFTVLEEFRAGTDPNRPESHPPFIDKLRLVARHAQVYRIRFDGPIDDRHFQVRRLPSAIRSEQSWILETGDVTEDGQIEIGRIEGSDLRATYLPAKQSLSLSKGKIREIPTWFAEFRVDLPGESPFFVREGDEFAISREPDLRYRLIAVSEEGATVARSNSEDSVEGARIEVPAEK